MEQNPTPEAAPAAQPALECAVEFLELLPLIMGSLHCEMRRETASTLTMAQFRLLTFLSQHGTASVSGIAQFMHLGLPATSKIIDGLVSSKAITRRGDPADRRRVLLEISPQGRSELLATRAISHQHLAKLLAPLSQENREKLLEALRALRPIFIKYSPDQPSSTPPPHE